MRVAVVIFAVALGGCRALIGIDEPVVASDALVGDGVDAVPTDARECFGVAPFELCTRAPVRTSFDVSAAEVLDTTSTCDVIIRGWCVVIANNVSIAGQLRLTGARPFALLALNAMTVSGTVSADANGSTAGPGADASTCNSGVAAQSGINGGGGGGGGSFATQGGAGGSGSGGGNAGGTAPAIVLVIDDLRGGCRGSVGGQGSTSANPAGAGGGAVYLLSAGALSISGKIDASGGGGGRGNASKSGGSGGGSGGMIVLWSPQITGSPSLIANGGGGGGGADNGASGTPGSECTSTAAANGGPGGGPLVGAGGKGSTGSGPGNSGTDDATGAGGGGGGGGGGVIRILGGNQLMNAMASPPPS